LEKKKTQGGTSPIVRGSSHESKGISPSHKRRTASWFLAKKKKTKYSGGKGNRAKGKR